MEFGNNYNDIYPDEMKLKKENEDPCKVSFLDLPVEVHYRKFTTDLLDEKDAFFFYIICMLYLGSNIPSKIFILQSVLKFYVFPGQ